MHTCSNYTIFGKIFLGSRLDFLFGARDMNETCVQAVPSALIGIGIFLSWNFASLIANIRMIYLLVVLKLFEIAKEGMLLTPLSCCSADQQQIQWWVLWIYVLQRNKESLLSTILRHLNIFYLVDFYDRRNCIGFKTNKHNSFLCKKDLWFEKLICNSYHPFRCYYLPRISLSNPFPAAALSILVYFIFLFAFQVTHTAVMHLICAACRYLSMRYHIFLKPANHAAGCVLGSEPCCTVTYRGTKIFNSNTGWAVLTCSLSPKHSALGTYYTATF